MEQTKENKMGVMPVNRLLITMSLPMMVSMLVQALYNIVDSIFVSRINENALTAVSLAFPIQSLMISVAVGTSVGINAVLSRALGGKKQEEVNRTAGNGVTIMAVSYVLFLLIGLFATRGFYLSQTDDAQIVQYGYEYLSVYAASLLECLYILRLTGSYRRQGRQFIRCLRKESVRLSILSWTLFLFSDFAGSLRWECAVQRWRQLLVRLCRVRWHF